MATAPAWGSSPSTYTLGPDSRCPPRPRRHRPRYFRSFHRICPPMSEPLLRLTHSYTLSTSSIPDPVRRPHLCSVSKGSPTIPCCGMLQVAPSGYDAAVAGLLSDPMASGIDGTTSDRPIAAFEIEPIRPSITSPRPADASLAHAFGSTE